MTPEEKFNEIWSGLTARIDFKEYPGIVFLFKGHKCYFEFNLKNGSLWCSWNNVWTIFSDQFGFGHSEIQKLIKDQVERHFNQRETTPLTMYRKAALPVERHFNQRETTPSYVQAQKYIKVEQHFNQREVTPKNILYNYHTTVEQHFNKKTNG